MTTEFEHRMNVRLEDLENRIVELEEELASALETIRGLEVDTGQNSDAINNLQSEQDDYRCELDEIGAEIDCHVQHGGRNP